MSAVSDGIESFILSLFQDQEGVELRRNELAQYFGCAPSQINYVLATRFSVDHGYVIHSKRGGGGYILIRRIPAEQRGLQACVTDQVGQQINLQRARALIHKLQQSRAVTPREADMMRAVIGNIPMLPASAQDHARAHLLRAMLLTLLGKGEGEDKSGKAGPSYREE